MQKKQLQKLASLDGKKNSRIETREFRVQELVNEIQVRHRIAQGDVIP